MTERRKVQWHDDPNVTAEVVGEFESSDGITYLWVVFEKGERLATYYADRWVDVPEYDPDKVPQVGELWHYPNGMGRKGTLYICIESDVDEGTWTMVDTKAGDKVFNPNAFGTEEKCGTTDVFKRKLPEERMVKYEG